MIVLALFILSSIGKVTSSFGAEGASTVGNGGSGVVCFVIPMNRAVNGGVITDEGRKGIEKAFVLEYYLAGLKTHKSAFMTRAADFDVQGARAILDGEINQVPQFREGLESANKRLGQIADGIPSRLGLLHVDDADLPIILPENCALLQLVIRRNDTFFFDSSLLAALAVTDPVQSYLLQLHEEVYFMATQYSHAANSIGTQLTLVSLMTEDLDAMSLEQVLLDNGVMNSTSWLDFH